MAPKPNANKWSDVQLAIAAISMTAVIGFWNMFAGPDRTKADEKTAAEQQALLIPTVTPTDIVEPPAPVVTMPPVGYTILFGGAAPQPQVIVVQKPRGGGGGDGNADSGGGGGGAASQPATSTSSS